MDRILVPVLVGVISAIGSSVMTTAQMEVHIAWLKAEVSKLYERDSELWHKVDAVEDDLSEYKTDHTDAHHRERYINGK